MTMTLVAALTRFAEAAAEAVFGVIGTLTPGQVQPGETEVVAEGGEPLAGFPVPLVATSATCADGSGGTLVVMTVAGARRLARAMAGMAQGGADADAGLEDIERSAVSEAMSQMLAAATRAAGDLLGDPIETSDPVTQVVEAPATAAELCADAPHATVTDLVVLGEPVRLIQLVPASLRSRLGVAPDDLGIEVGVRSVAGPLTGGGTDLSGITMRVSAELGRARMHAGRAVALPGGTVVELDADVDAPVELLVNGVPFATGRLLVTEDGEWAVQVERVADVLAGSPPAPAGAPAGPAVTVGLG